MQVFCFLWNMGRYVVCFAVSEGKVTVSMINYFFLWVKYLFPEGFGIIFLFVCFGLLLYINVVCTYFVV